MDVKVVDHLFEGRYELGGLKHDMEKQRNGLYGVWNTCKFEKDCDFEMDDLLTREKDFSLAKKLDAFYEKTKDWSLFFTVMPSFRTVPYCASFLLRRSFVPFIFL